jgi:hypothetical protein
MTEKKCCTASHSPERPLAGRTPDSVHFVNTLIQPFTSGKNDKILHSLAVPWRTLQQGALIFFPGCRPAERDSFRIVFGFSDNTG